MTLTKNLQNTSWVCKLQGWVCKLNSVVCIFWFALLMDKIATRDCLRSMKRMQWTSSTQMLLLRWLQHMLKCPTACSKNAKIQKTSRKPKNKKTIFQDSCKSKNANIQNTSRKPKKTKKQYSRTLAKVKMQKTKKRNLEKTKKKQKKQKTKKQHSRTLACWPYLQTSGILFFFCFLEVFWIFAFLLHAAFFLFFCLFLFFLLFLFNCAKSFLVELWADKRVQKVDLGGVSIYIYITIL